MDDLEFGMGQNDLVTFGNPFATYSNKVYPRTIREVMEWAEWLWLRHGVYAQAIQRSIRYFMSGIELVGADVGKDTRRQYEKSLIEDYNILDKLALVGDDYMGFGNSFTSVSLPISRSIQCMQKGCGLLRSVDNLVKGRDYEWDNFKFRGTCPQCGRMSEFKVIDSRRVKEDSKLLIIRWPMNYVAIDHVLVSGFSEYYCKVPEDIVSKIRAGDPLTLRTVPWEFISAVEKNRYLKMNPDTFIHLKSDTCSTLLLKLKGWGLPKFMSCFSQVVQLQMLDRFNEAIATDFITPMRLLTPALTAGGMDPLQTFGMQNFMGAVRGMLEEHRMDPTSWHTLPAPVQYHMIGGEAKNLVPTELIDRTLDNLLSSMGVASEFYRGSLSAGGPPIGLRMFEKTWIHHTAAMDQWLNWFLDKCNKYLMWKKVHGHLIKSSVAEDDTTKQVKLNLAASRVISNYTALRAFDIDPNYERERMKEEATEAAEDQREDSARENKASMLDEFVQQAPPGSIPPNAGQANMGLPPGQAAPPAAGGIMPQGGAGAAPIGGQPPNGSPSIDQLLAEADQTAQQLLQAPPSQRKAALAQLRQTRPELHAQVRMNLEKMERQVGSQAVAQMKEQGQQPGAAPPGNPAGPAGPGQ